MIKTSTASAFRVSVALLALVFTSSAIAAKQSLNYVEQSKIGNPAKVLVVKSESPRKLNAGEVRVRVLATPIHPSNLVQISGNYGVQPKIPSTPGTEGIGRVIEVSKQVSHLSEGQLVFLVNDMGTWRDELVAPAASFIPLPDMGDLSQDIIEQLSMTAVNPLTASLLLRSFADLKEGDWIVQNASNSAVGGYLIQLAKQRGIKTVSYTHLTLPTIYSV